MRTPARRSLSASDRLDERVDAWFDPYRSNEGAQKVLYAASLLAETALLGGGAAVAVADSPDADVTRARVASGALAALLTGVAKQLVGRSRPFRPRRRPLAVNPDTSSFPSGHALWAVLAAAELAEDRVPAWAAYPAAAFVGISRVHLRLHRASDVLAATAIAATVWTLIRRSDSRSTQHHSQPDG